MTKPKGANPMPKCSEQVYRGDFWHPCTYTASVKRPGLNGDRFYCGVHDPAAIFARQLAAAAKRRAQWEGTP